MVKCVDKRLLKKSIKLNGDVGGIAMADLLLLSDAQMRRIEPYFPLSHGIAGLTIDGCFLGETLSAP